MFWSNEDLAFSLQANDFWIVVKKQYWEPLPFDVLFIVLVAVVRPHRGRYSVFAFSIPGFHPGLLTGGPFGAVAFNQVMLKNG